MHGELPESKNDSPPPPPGVAWYKTLTRYHWFVLSVAALGWLFDCLDQQLFVLARPAAMKSLVAERETPQATASARRLGGDIATSIFIAGWACGGLFFGMLGDRYGRAKTMVITILLYSLFTGLSAISTGLWDFAFYRFLTGLGVGGEFAVGVALVAEVMPNHARPYTLGLLQALSALGNISAAFINLGLGIAEEHGLPASPWRIMFLVGALPALLALVIRAKLKEPEQWTKASLDNVVGKQLGSYSALFSDPVWRKHAILGLILGCSGIIGLWSVGFYTPDLIREVQKKGVSLTIFADKAEEAAKAGLADVAASWRAIADAEQSNVQLSSELSTLRDTSNAAINGQLSRWSSYTSLMINVGAFFGMFSFGALSQRIGRKPTFVLALLAAFVTTVSVFGLLREFWQIFVMVPIMGFCQLSLFGGYAIYFPELFPTRLRSTGTSFCYNVGRFLAALGPLVKAGLDSGFASAGFLGTEALRYSGMTMCLVFLVGLFVLPFLPETKGRPLPE
jgi:MFS family permease